MGSRRNWREMCARSGAIALLLVAVAGCGDSGQTFSTRPPAGPHASGVRVVVPSASNAVGSGAIGSGAPRATGAAVTVDNITAKYTFKLELITPLENLYGNKLDDFVIATIVNHNAAPVKIMVSSQINSYTDAVSETVTIAASGTAVVRQNPRLTPTAIDGLNSAKQADLHVVVSYLDNGQPRTVLDQTSSTLITSRRDFPWTIKGFSQQADYNLIAAMVTPTDPGVEKLIRTAANYDPNHVMTSGYDSANDTSGSVWQRLSDIWQAETANFKLTYISTTITFSASSSQRIRLPAEVLSQSSGNCIELTLLYAAVAEALNLQPSIILVPGHAYVAIRVDDTNDNYYFIETTMIGQATFKQSVAEGNSEWATAQPHLNAGEADYGWVDVAAARAKGIVPIPWH